MKKILSSLMILTLVVLFAASYVISSKAEGIFKAQIDQLNKDYPGVLQVEVLDYQRGLLVSEVRTNVILKQDVLPLQHQIRHFPWKVRIMTGIAGDSPLAAELAGLLPLEKLQLQTDVGLDGSSKTEFALAKLDVSDQQTNLLLEGFSFDCTLDGELNNAQLQLQLDNLAITEAGAADFALSDFQIHSQLSDLQGLPLGSSLLQFGRLSLNPEQESGFKLDNFSYQVSSELSGEQIIAQLKLHLATLELAGERFDEGLLQLRSNGISAPAARQMLIDVRQFQAQAIEQQSDPLLLQLQLLEIYAKLFQDGLTFTLDDLLLKTDGGGMAGKGKITLQGLNLAGQPLPFEQLDGAFQLDIDRPLFNAGFRLFSKLQSSGREINPAVLNEQAEQVAGGLIQKGILTRQDDGGYRLELSLSQDAVRLNGRPVNL